MQAWDKHTAVAKNGYADCNLGRSTQDQEEPFHKLKKMFHLEKRGAADKMPSPNVTKRLVAFEVLRLLKPPLQ